jgi:hypothetical protein
MNRRELLISLGLIALPKQKLIFDMGANLHRVEPLLFVEPLTVGIFGGINRDFLYYTATEDIAAYSLCTLDKGKASTVTTTLPAFGRPVTIGVPRVPVKKGEFGFFFTGPSPKVRVAC